MDRDPNSNPKAVAAAQVTNKTVIISTLLSHMRLIAFEPGLFIANVKFLQVVVRMTIEIVYVLHNARNYLVLVVSSCVGISQRISLVSSGLVPLFHESHIFHSGPVCF